MKKILQLLSLTFIFSSCSSDIWQGVLGGLGMASMQMASMPYSSTPSSGSGNMDYLLNPALAVSQAQQQVAQEQAVNNALMATSLKQTYDQEQAEYQEAKKYRPNLTLEQWRAEMGAATLYGKQQDNTRQVTNNNVNNNVQTPSSKYTISAHDCAYCHGTGEIIYEKSVAGFGTATDHVRKRCDVCGATYIDIHKHMSCGHCGGTGKMRM